MTATQSDASELVKPIQQMSDSEIVSLMRGPSLLADVRRIFYNGVAEMEQAEAQREKPSIIEQRKREFIISQRIIKAVREEAAATIQRLTADAARREDALRNILKIAERLEFQADHPAEMVRIQANIKAALAPARTPEDT